MNKNEGVGRKQNIFLIFMCFWSVFPAPKPFQTEGWEYDFGQKYSSSGPRSFLGYPENSRRISLEVYNSQLQDMQDGRDSTEHTDSSRGASQSKLLWKHPILETSHLLMSDKKHSFHAWASEMSPASLKPLLSVPEQENPSTLLSTAFQCQRSSEVRNGPGSTACSAITACFSPVLHRAGHLSTELCCSPFRHHSLPQCLSAGSTWDAPWDFLNRHSPKCN